MGVERPAHHTFSISPHLAHQFGARHDDALPPDQHREQVESDPRQLERPSVAPRHSRRDIDLQVAGTQLNRRLLPRHLPRPCTPKQHFHSNEQLLDAEGFRHVVVGAKGPLRPRRQRGGARRVIERRDGLTLIRRARPIASTSARFDGRRSRRAGTLACCTTCCTRLSSTLT